LVVKSHPHCIGYSMVYYVREVDQQTLKEQTKDKYGWKRNIVL